MSIVIDNYDFEEFECQKYWAPPASWSDEKKKTEGRSRIFSGDWFGSQKRDGALYVLIKDLDGNIILRGRSKSVQGKYLDKWDHLPHLFNWGKNLPNGTVLLGEIYWKGNEGSNKVTTIMNCLTDKAIARQKTDDTKLRYYVFDVMAYNGKSFLNKTAKERFDFIASNTIPKDFFVEFAEYKAGEELWSMLQELLASGYEGIVITKADSFYEPGKRPSKTTQKLKRELRETIDVIILGANAPTRMYGGKEILTWKYWENRVTGEKIQGELYKAFCDGEPIDPITKAYFHGWAGSLIIGLYDAAADKVVPIGSVSGLTEEVLQNWQGYKGKVLEVGGMQLMRDDDGNFTGIRHPKAISFRMDKLARECTMDQVK